MTGEPQAPEFREPLPERKSERNKPKHDNNMVAGDIASNVGTPRSVLEIIEIDNRMNHFLNLFFKGIK